MNPRKSSLSNNGRDDEKGKDSSRKESSNQNSARLELIPELVDKRIFATKKNNPNYICAGPLYIPKNIVQMVAAENIQEMQENVFPDKFRNDVADDEVVEVKDPQLRRYIQRIVRYSEYNPEDAVSKVRKASYEIKQQARHSVQKEDSVNQVEIWDSFIEYEDTDSNDDLEEGNKELVPIHSRNNGPKHSFRNSRLLSKFFGNFKKGKKS